MNVVVKINFGIWSFDLQLECGVMVALTHFVKCGVRHMILKTLKWRMITSYYTVEKILGESVKFSTYLKLAMHDYFLCQ